MTDGHLWGCQKLRAASRAGAAAPGPSSPALALPARGRRRRRQAAFGTCPARGRGGALGLGQTRGLALPEETRAYVAAPAKSRRSWRPCQHPKSSGQSRQAQARPVARRPPGQPRAWPGLGPRKAAEGGQNVLPPIPEGPGSSIPGPIVEV